MSNLLIDITGEGGRVIGHGWRCACGTLVDSYGTDVSCENCGQLYNAFGQRLEPPHRWEEAEDY